MKLINVAELSPRQFVLDEEVSPELRKNLLQMLFLALASQRSYGESLDAYREIRGSVDPNYSAKQSRKGEKLRAAITKAPEGAVRLGIFYGRPAKLQFISNDKFVGYLRKMVNDGKNQCQV